MVTIKEIAKIAGVSTATVSHVINSSRFVSAEITNRVHEAMRATGYKPNIAAYALRTQKTKTIGLLLPILMDETSNVYFMQMMLGIEAVFEAEGYCVILGNTQENVQVEKQMLEHFQNRMVDGLIVAPTCDSQAFVREILGEKPTVFVDREPQELKGVDCVVNDTQRGSREAVEMLIKEGHRHIGILSGILGKNTMADLRIQGYLEAMEKYDIPVIMLITPETSDERIRLIDEYCGGFIYMVSSASTTGVKDRFTAGQIEYFQRIDRLNLKNKRLIGFGISNGESLSTVCRYSSGAIIGSLFVKLLGTEPTVEEAVDHLLKIAHRDGL